MPQYWPSPGDGQAKHRRAASINLISFLFSLFSPSQPISPFTLSLVAPALLSVLLLLRPILRLLILLLLLPLLSHPVVACAVLLPPVWTPSHLSSSGVHLLAAFAPSLLQPNPLPSLSLLPSSCSIADIARACLASCRCGCNCNPSCYGAASADCSFAFAALALKSFAAHSAGRRLRFPPPGSITICAL